MDDDALVNKSYEGQDDFVASWLSSFKMRWYINKVNLQEIDIEIVALIVIIRVWCCRIYRHSNWEKKWLNGINLFKNNEKNYTIIRKLHHVFVSDYTYANTPAAEVEPTVHALTTNPTVARPNTIISDERTTEAALRGSRETKVWPGICVNAL